MTNGTASSRSTARQVEHVDLGFATHRPPAVNTLGAPDLRTAVPTSVVEVRPRPMAGSKRLFDLVVGALLSIVTLPITLSLAILSALRFRAFPFFVQQRVGLHGEKIRCIKIRTLPADTPAYLDKAALQDHGAEDRVAEAVRNLHLDELPQFWQVVTGTLSLVGPRPMIESIVERMPEDVASLRHSVRPGITGPWQISTDGGNLIHDTCDYDLAYLRHSSPWVDLRVLAWTAVQVVGVRKRSKDAVFHLMRVAGDEPHAALLDLDRANPRAARALATANESVSTKAS